MAGFMKNAMSYLGMSDVVDDEVGIKCGLRSRLLLLVLLDVVVLIVQAVPRWPCEQNHHHPSEVI